MQAQKQNLLSLSPGFAGEDDLRCFKVVLRSDSRAEQIHGGRGLHTKIEFCKILWQENPQNKKREIKIRTVMESWYFSKIADPVIGPQS